jgi:hypothetical protein
MTVPLGSARYRHDGLAGSAESAAPTKDTPNAACKSVGVISAQSCSAEIIGALATVAAARPSLCGLEPGGLDSVLGTTDSEATDD